MSPTEVFDALGGGLAGILGAALVVVTGLFFAHLKGQITELRSDNRELRETLTRLTDVVESWMPEGQRKRLRQP